MRRCVLRWDGRAAPVKTFDDERISPRQRKIAPPRTGPRRAEMCVLQQNLPALGPMPGWARGCGKRNAVRKNGLLATRRVGHSKDRTVQGHRRCRTEALPLITAGSCRAWSRTCACCDHYSGGRRAYPVEDLTEGKKVAATGAGANHENPGHTQDDEPRRQEVKRGQRHRNKQTVRRGRLGRLRHRRRRRRGPRLGEAAATVLPPNRARSNAFCLLTASRTRCSPRRASLLEASTSRTLAKAFFAAAQSSISRQHRPRRYRALAWRGSLSKTSSQSARAPLNSLSSNRAAARLRYNAAR